MELLVTIISHPLFLVLAGALPGALWTWLSSRKSEQSKLLARITELELQIKLIVQQALPVNTAFQAMLVKTLTHFHTPELDALLVKLGPPYVLTPDEELRMVELLAARAAEVNNLIPEDEKEAAIMLPMVIKRVRTELNQVTPIVVPVEDVAAK